jgi:aromatic ring-opening dioxygenase catalytic subunit (LigB family)
MSETRLPTYFFSHGGGPWPYMKDQFGHAFDRLEASIVDLRRQLGAKPRAILMVTGHWEEPEFRVSSSPAPPMLYDYYGFPEHTYRVRYGAPGSPALAARVQALLQEGGLACRQDEARGFDHGTFTVMEPLYPEADVPVVQLSIRRDFAPETHLAAGRLLAPLRDEGVLILGSGLSYHNLRRMDRSAAVPSQQFDAWLQETLVRSTSPERSQALAAWATAPAARVAHPREDHFLPLMVAVGAAEAEPGACVYHEDAFMGTMAVSSFRFGAAPAEAAA